MKPHTTYRIYPKAIRQFINDNYDLNNINFGNIKNNVIAILQKLKIDTILDADWDVSPLYFFDKKNISKNNNKPSDFDEYSNFNFTFSLKEGKSSKDFENAIQNLESNFISKYQNILNEEQQTHKKQLIKQQKKKEQFTYLFIFIGLLILLSFLYFVKGK